MQTKKQWQVLVIVGIIIFIIMANQKMNKQENVGMKIHYYSNGVEVNPGFQIFSLVSPPTPGINIDQISIDITVTNPNQIPMANVGIFNASPIQFYNNITKDTYALNQGQSHTWHSGNMSTVDFEGLSQPVNFMANFSGLNTYTQYTNYFYAINPITITNIQKGLCYQESANISTACGGLSTGKYYVSCVGGDGNFYINYTKPAGSSNKSVWQVRPSLSMNLTITSSCFSRQPLQLRIYQASNSLNTNQFYYCWSGGSWVQLYTTGTRSTSARTGSSSNVLYDGDWQTRALCYNNNWVSNVNSLAEEAMIWDIG